MRAWASAASALILGVLAVVTPAQAAPPPPPPDEIDALAKQLVTTPTSETFSRYTDLLADDLHVLRNGQEIAADKRTWVASQKRLVGKVDRRLVLYSEGYTEIMIVDQYDDVSDMIDKRGMIFDSRFRTRVAHYEVGGDHLIHRIRFEEAQGQWRVVPDVNLAPIAHFNKP